MTSTALFPAAVTGASQFRVIIEAEILIVTNVAGTTWTVTRGAEGTTAAAHASGVAVWQILTAASLFTLREFCTFGTGVDGAATISTTVTLTRSMHYTDLTLTSPGRLIPNGYRVFVSGTLTVGAGCSIDMDGGTTGNNAGGGTPGSNVRPLSQGATGQNGSTTGAAGQLPTAGVTYMLGGHSGAGGAGWAAGAISGAGGAATTGNRLIDAAGIGGAGAQMAAEWLSPWSLAEGRITTHQNNAISHAIVTPGAGGASGAGPDGGGGGGGGGGHLVIAARTVVNNGRISANGGNGSSRNYAATATSGNGGGGGGGGGICIVITNAYTGANPQATGGTAGAAYNGVSVAGGAAQPGTAGGAGFATKWVLGA